MLMDAKDLTAFSPTGFSLVTNMRLIFTDDVNITPMTTPPGRRHPSMLEKQFSPPRCPFSLRKKRFGDSGIALKIDLERATWFTCQGTIAEPVRIADLKSGFADRVRTQKTLLPI